MSVELVGQEKLKKIINGYSYSNMPQSILLIGTSGCGKHSFASYMAEKINVQVLEITENINDELLTILYDTVVPMLYLVDLSKITEKSQNVLLKFVEEPPRLSRIILLCENINCILPTIINRCVQLQFSRYSKEELSKFTSDEFTLKFLYTPGEILSTSHQSLVSMDDTCNDLVNTVRSSSYDKLISVISKINYSDEYDKYDINIFFRVLAEKFYDLWVRSGDYQVLKTYLFTDTKQKELRDARISKQNFMRKYLSELWVTNHE